MKTTTKKDFSIILDNIKQTDRKIIEII